MDTSSGLHFVTKYMGKTYESEIEYTVKTCEVLQKVYNILVLTTNILCDND